MTDAISRSAVLAGAEEIDWYHVNQNGKLVSGSTSDDVSYVKYDDVVHMLEDAPSLDVAPVVHARWIYYGDVNEDGNCEANCSACGAGDAHRPDLKNAIPYCWNCGARMDGEAE